MMRDGKRGRPAAGGTVIKVRVSDAVLDYLKRVQEHANLRDRSSAGALVLERDAAAGRYLDASTQQ